MLGGVDIYVEKRLQYADRAAGLYIDIPKGLQHMDGETALKFVRFRHDALGDIGRIKRQQQFMNALLQKIFDQAISAKMPLLLKGTSANRSNGLASGGGAKISDVFQRRIV